jgi:hypothetical protein
LLLLFSFSSSSSSSSSNVVDTCAPRVAAAVETNGWAGPLLFFSSAHRIT